MLPLCPRVPHEASTPATLSVQDYTIRSVRCPPRAHRGVPVVCSGRTGPRSGRKLSPTLPVSPCRFFATVSDAAGQQQGHQLARHAALLGKQVAVLLLRQRHWKSTHTGNSLVAYSTSRPVLRRGGESNLASLSRPVCRRLKVVSVGTRRHRPGSRRGRRCALPRRGDMPRPCQILCATKCEKLSDPRKTVKDTRVQNLLS